MFLCCLCSQYYYLCYKLCFYINILLPVAMHGHVLSGVIYLRTEVVALIILSPSPFLSSPVATNEETF
jgi:hypothetical protein